MQKRALRTRRRLMRAGLALFAEQGVDLTPVAAITERADLGKGTFYRHFKDKQELLNDLTREALSELVERLRESCGAAGDLRSLMGAMLKVHKAFFVEDRERFHMLFQGRIFLQLQREDSVELEQPFQAYLEALQEQFRRVTDHTVSSEKIRRLAVAVAGFVSGFLSFGLIGLPEDEVEAGLDPLRQVFISAAAAFLEEPKGAS